MKKTTKLISLIMSIVMILSIFNATGISAFAYEKYEEDPRSSIETAPTLVLNQSDTFYCRRGYYEIDGSDYIIGETSKYYKFVPSKSAYYQVDVSTPSNNRSYWVYWAYDYDAENSTVRHTGGNDGFVDTKDGVHNNRAAGYLTAGKTYYVVINSYIDDYDIEPEQSSVEHTIKLTNHTHDYEVDTYDYSDCTYAYYSCKICDYYYSADFYKPKTLTLSTTSYTYDGNVKKPSVTVKDSNGKTISSSYYTVSYASGRKNVGSYKVTVKFKKEYARFGSLSKSFTIKPKNTSISSVTAKSKGFTVKWKKYTTQTTGYQIRYSTKSNMSGAKTVTISKNSTTSKTISKLSAKKKYYVQIRTYKTVNGTKYYSGWSKSKTVTTKK
jgi:hypothetical protein